MLNLIYKEVKYVILYLFCPYVCIILDQLTTPVADCVHYCSCSYLTFHAFKEE